MRLIPSRPTRIPAARLPVLPVTIAADAGHTGHLTDVVTARVTACAGEVGTVIVALTGDMRPDDTVREDLYALYRHLNMSGIRLHLVTSRDDWRRFLVQDGQKGTLDPLAVYPTLRSAVLASYAKLPGPGLVTGAVRAALAASTEIGHIGQGEFIRGG